MRPGGTSVAGLSTRTGGKLGPAAALTPSSGSGVTDRPHPPFSGHSGSRCSPNVPVVPSGLSRRTGGRIRDLSATLLPHTTSKLKVRVTRSNGHAAGRKRGAAVLDTSTETSSPATNSPLATPGHQSDNGRSPSSEARHAAAAHIMVTFRGQEKGGGVNADDAEQQTTSVYQGKNSKTTCVCTNPACRGKLWNGRDCGLQRCGGFEGKCVCFAKHRLPKPTKQRDQVREVLQILRPDDDDEAIDHYFRTNEQGMYRWESARIHTSHYQNKDKKWGRTGGGKIEDGDRHRANRILINAGALPRYDPFIENEALLTAQVRACGWCLNVLLS